MSEVTSKKLLSAEKEMETEGAVNKAAVLGNGKFITPCRSNEASGQGFLRTG